MTKKNNSQPELLMETPADITTGKTGEAPAADLEIIDDSPEKPSADLRKFNRAAAEVAKALNPLKLILKISDIAGVDSAMLHMKAAKAVETMIENKRKDLVTPWNAEVKRINGHAADLVKDVPTQINRVKSLVLTFQMEEELRVKRERTSARNTQLLSLGMTPKTVETHDGKKIVSSWTNDQEQIITQYQVEETPDDQWAFLLFTQATERAEQAVKDLKKAQKAADFFGEDSTDVTAQAEAVKAPPVRAAFSTGGSFPTTKIKGATKTWTFETIDLSLVPREYLQLDEAKIRAAIVAGTRSIAGINIFQKDSISLR